MSLRPLLAIVCLGGLLQACTPLQQGQHTEQADATTADTGVDVQDAATEQAQQSRGDQPVPELTLNLPQQDACQCSAIIGPPLEARDYTFLERGLNTMLEGDHSEALKYFQRYQRLEKSPVARWESEVAIAYMSTLPNSPFFDPEAARESHRKLEKRWQQGMQVHQQTLLMHASLGSFAELERHIEELESNNATLKEDLAKREDALKRLRELTLGQQRGAKR